MHLVYYQGYVKLWIACWWIWQITASFLDITQTSANNIITSFQAMVHESTNNCNITLFHAENVAFAGRGDSSKELFN